MFLFFVVVFGKCEDFEDDVVCSEVYLFQPTNTRIKLLINVLVFFFNCFYIFVHILDSSANPGDIYATL